MVRSGERCHEDREREKPSEPTDDNIGIALEGIEDITGETSVLIPIGGRRADMIWLERRTPLKEESRSCLAKGPQVVQRSVPETKRLRLPNCLGHISLGG